MTTLTSFLLARIADDEAVARTALMRRDADEGPDGEPWRLWWQDVPSQLCAQPTRVLAECEAKRRVLDMGWAAEDLEALTAVLTLPYAGHEDFREEWRA